MNARRITLLAMLGFGLLVQTGPATGPLQYFTVTPCRLADTRDPVGPTGGPALAAGATRNFAVFGSNSRQQCGIPTSAKAVSVNAAVLGPAATGYLTMWANGATIPSTSNINFNVGEPALANGALVKLTYPPNDLVNTSYQVAVFSSASTNFILDVTGYYQ